MREKDFNTGLRGVLFEARHYARMGAAVWLYGWLVLRQTHESGGVGYVLGGAPVTYREIEQETGFNRRTLEAWMRVLRREGYIETRQLPAGISIQILKAKKHRAPVAPARSSAANPGQATMKFRVNGDNRASGRYSQPCARGSAESLREVTVWGTRDGVASGPESTKNQGLATSIGSSSIVGLKENPSPDIHRRVENHGCANPNPTERSLPWVSPESFSDENLKTLPVEQTPKKLHSQNGAGREVVAGASIARGRAETQAGPNATHKSRFGESEAYRSPQTQFPWELRKRMQLLRAQREDELRRELYVGTGPEGRR
jgi:hypothetical protein